VPKGKPWTKEEEQTLIKLVGQSKIVDVIAKVLGKTENAVYIKVRRLGLRVEEESETNRLSSSRSKLPGELPSIETVMKRLSAALSALEQPGIVTRYDAIVLDEVQSIKGDSAGEVIAGLRVYLESGRFSRGSSLGKRVDVLIAHVRAQNSGIRHTIRTMSKSIAASAVNGSSNVSRKYAKKREVFRNYS
jgi:hypothetical protein